MYKHSNNKAMTTGAIAAMLSTILYSRRFFPYYVYNIIGGLDEEGGCSVGRGGRCSLRWACPRGVRALGTGPPNLPCLTRRGTRTLALQGECAWQSPCGGRRAAGHGTRSPGS